MNDQPGRQAIDTHVHVWPLDDAPGHRLAADAKIRPPQAAVPVEWLLDDMAEATGAIMQFHLWPHHAPALARMVERHPTVPLIVDHLGRPDVTEPPPYATFEPVLRLADSPNVYAKIGIYKNVSKQESPWRDTWPFVRLLADRFGAQRMLWGTGYPGAARRVPLELALRYVETDLPLSDDERRQILWDTPAQLFGFPAA